MTSPNSAALPDDSVAAVQGALGAEHAAIWVYGLVSAFLPQSMATKGGDAMAKHRARRDATERLLAEAGQTPDPAEPAYVPPKPVTDQASAIAVLVLAEADCTVAWRAVLERTDDAKLRKAALDALTGAAVRAAGWRRTAGDSPATPALPGKPS